MLFLFVINNLSAVIIPAINFCDEPLAMFSMSDALSKVGFKINNYLKEVSIFTELSNFSFLVVQNYKNL